MMGVWGGLDHGAHLSVKWTDEPPWGHEFFGVRGPDDRILLNGERWWPQAAAIPPLACPLPLWALGPCGRGHCVARMCAHMSCGEGDCMLASLHHLQYTGGRVLLMVCHQLRMHGGAFPFTPSTCALQRPLQLLQTMQAGAPYGTCPSCTARLLQTA